MQSEEDALHAAHAVISSQLAALHHWRQAYDTAVNETARRCADIAYAVGSVDGEGWAKPGDEICKAFGLVPNGEFPI